MKLGLPPQYKKFALISTATLAVALIALALSSHDGKAATEEHKVRPALSVSVETPQLMRLSQHIAANGAIEAWQEAIIGANVSGLILADVRVNVGDMVKRGDVLASFANQSVAADLEQDRAHAAEAEATALEAEANAERAKKVADSGALSAQQLNQYLTDALTARARAKAQAAAVRAREVKLADTRVVAPDDGVISARTATVGAVPSNPELFRLIRKGRLEWRAEVPAAQMLLLKPGMNVHLNAGAGINAEGKIRVLAPSIDPKTRNGLVYVDLPGGKPGTLRAGMFASGEFEVGASDGLTLPQSAVMVRDGYSFVFLANADGKVMQTKVETGRRIDDRIEIISGLDVKDRVVIAGGGFLTDGDQVRIVNGEATPASSNSK